MYRATSNLYDVKVRSGDQKAKEKVAEENARSRQEVAEDAATVTALRAEVEQLRVRESEAAGQVNTEL